LGRAVNSLSGTFAPLSCSKQKYYMILQMLKILFFSLIHYHQQSPLNKSCNNKGKIKEKEKETFFFRRKKEKRKLTARLLVLAASAT
jgi:hypothetical protein